MRPLPFCRPLLLLIALANAAYGGETAEVGGLRVEVPPGWIVNTELLALKGPIMLSTVPMEKDGHGGVLPPDAAQITVREVESDAAGPEATLSKAVKLAPDDQPQRTTEKVGLNDAARLSYTWDSMDGLMYFDYAAVHIGKQAVVFSLVSRGRDDASRDEFRTTLRSLMTSTTVTAVPATPGEDKKQP